MNLTEGYNAKIHTITMAHSHISHFVRVCIILNFDQAKRKKFHVDEYRLFVITDYIYKLSVYRVFSIRIFKLLDKRNQHIHIFTYYCKKNSIHT